MEPTKETSDRGRRRALSMRPGAALAPADGRTNEYVATQKKSCHGPDPAAAIVDRNRPFLHHGIDAYFACATKRPGSARRRPEQARAALI
jgi:hypothetical protein